MNFISTRNNNEQVSFSNAILNCLPSDGGLYVPAYSEDLSPWVSHMDESTTFASIAGSLTSALIKEEFSPIISEAIADKAFSFSPELKKLDDDFYVLELFHGPTGTHKDFGLSYLASCLEHVLLMKECKATVLASTDGETGAAIASALRGKENIKAVLLYAKGTMRGFKDTDCVWNGGNIYPVEVDGDKRTCYELTRAIYRQPELIKKFSLTLANTANIGRLLPHTFLYMYAFSRLKKQLNGNLFYAIPAGNYGNITAGLYGWKYSLPLNGIITNCTATLTQDALGKCSILDSLVPLSHRGAADPVEPSSVERLEEIFMTNPAVMKAFVFPTPVTDEEATQASQELFVKYSRFFDLETSRAYEAAIKQGVLTEGAGSSVVLVATKDPSLCAASIKSLCGETPKMDEKLQAVYAPIKPEKKIQANVEDVEKILSELQSL